MFLNKKGQEGPPGDWLIFIIVLLIAVPVIILLFMAIINNTIVYKTVTPYLLEEYILTNKFLSSDECFSHYDALSGEYIPLTLDKNKFNEKRMESCYPNKGSYYALRLTLMDGDKQTTITTPNWDEDRGANRRMAPQFVTLYEDDNHKLAKIVFEIQNVQK